MPWSLALGGLVRAGLMRARSNSDGARERLGPVIDLLDGLGAKLYAAAARRQLGRLVGGEEGRSLSGQADAWMMTQEIRNPGRMAAALVPGFPDQGFLSG